MSSESQPKWKEKLEQIEVEIGNTTPLTKETSQNVMATVGNWFGSLPTFGKSSVGLFAISVFFSLLKTVFSLLQLLFSLSILAVIGYFVYQFVLKSNQESS